MLRQLRQRRQDWRRLGATVCAAAASGAWRCAMATPMRALRLWLCLAALSARVSLGMLQGQRFKSRAIGSSGSEWRGGLGSGSRWRRRQQLASHHRRHCRYVWRCCASCCRRACCRSRHMSEGGPRRCGVIAGGWERLHSEQPQEPAAMLRQRCQLRRQTLLLPLHGRQRHAGLELPSRAILHAQTQLPQACSDIECSDIECSAV